jgi:hypothetical protein
MNSFFIQKCGDSPQLIFFLQKGYGLELLFSLEDMAVNGDDNGIDDTYNSIRFHKPLKVAFSQYCELLKSNGSIVVVRSARKRSKRILRLSDLSLAQLSEARRLSLINKSLAKVTNHMFSDKILPPPPKGELARRSTKERRLRYDTKTYSGKCSGVLMIGRRGRLLLKDRIFQGSPMFGCGLADSGRVSFYKSSITQGMIE